MADHRITTTNAAGTFTDVQSDNLRRTVLDSSWLATLSNGQSITLPARNLEQPLYARMATGTTGSLAIVGAGLNITVALGYASGPALLTLPGLDPEFGQSVTITATTAGTIEIGRALRARIDPIAA